VLSIISRGSSRAFPVVVQRHFGLALLLTFCMSPLQSATLERLSLDDMIAKSTAITRGTVIGSHVSVQGPIIYTRYTIQVTEQFKGNLNGAVDVVVPGGIANNLRQTFAGAPQFNIGDDYVFFLWTGKSGLTQIIGLTQGLFAISGATTSSPTATRLASKELMLDPGTGRQVKDQTLVMGLSDLRSHIAGALAGSGAR